MQHIAGNSLFGARRGGDDQVPLDEGTGAEKLAAVLPNADHGRHPAVDYGAGDGAASDVLRGHFVARVTGHPIRHQVGEETVGRAAKCGEHTASAKLTTSILAYLDDEGKIIPCFKFQI